jgi:LPS export ABC transporter protein LptC
MRIQTQNTHWGSPYLLALSSALLAMQVIVFWSKSLERTGSDPFQETLDANQVSAEINAGAPFRAPHVPETGLPEYFIHQFHFVSTRGSEKLWRIRAERARFFVTEDFVHTLEVRAEVYSQDSPPVLIEAAEGKSMLQNRDLELFGNVIVRFPSGFVLRTPYLKYVDRERKITVPDRLPVTGENKEIRISSFGMNSFLRTQEIHLTREVIVHAQEQTEVRSDQAWIDHKLQMAAFSMNPNRASTERYVRAQQPSLTAVARKMTLFFGSRSPGKGIARLVADEDVRIDEQGENLGRYATSGRAEFEANSDTITLRKFPQVYRDRDTVTGEVIRMFRGSSLIEVERSNAFSEGQR